MGCCLCSSKQLGAGRDKTLKKDERELWKCVRGLAQLWRLYGDQACPHLVVEGMFGSASVLSDIYEHIYLFTLINLCIKVQL